MNPPAHDDAAEQAVLSAILLDQDRLGDVSAILSESDWWDGRHRLVWNAILAVSKRGDAVDFVSVANELRATNRLRQVGDTAYLAQLTEATPAVANIATHASIVAGLSRVRRVQQTAARLVAEAYQPIPDVNAWLSEADEQMFAASRGVEQRDTLERLGDGIARYLSQPKPTELVSTGLGTLNRMLGGGLGRGNLYVIAGRPGMGKSGLALGVALRAAKTGAVHFASLEMPREQTVVRSLSAGSGVNNHNVASRSLGKGQWDKIAGAADRGSKLALYTDDMAGQSVAYLRGRIRTTLSRARRHDKSARLNLVVVDYIQLMKGDGKSREEQVSSCARGLCELAREFDVPVIALSQLNRGVESRTDKRPLLSDLRESGAIEQDAFGVMMLYRDDYYHEDSRYPGEAELNVAKLRQGGRCGILRLRFSGETTTFGEFEDHEMYGDIGKEFDE